MGLLSTLAFALIPLVRRSSESPSPTDEVLELRRERDEALAEAARWRGRYEVAVEMYQRAIAPIVDRELVAQEVADRRFRQMMMQAQQMQAQMNAQMNAQMAMQSQNLASQALFGQSQLGQAAQNQWPHCTCVPGRADALLRGDLP
jgi:hypothetical protein